MLRPEVGEQRERACSPDIARPVPPPTPWIRVGPVRLPPEFGRPVRAADGGVASGNSASQAANFGEGTPLNLTDLSGFSVNRFRDEGCSSA